MPPEMPAPDAAPAPAAPAPAAPAPTPAPAPAPAALAPDAAPPAPAPAAPTNYFKELPDAWRTQLAESAGFEGDEATKRAGQLERVLDMGTFTKNYFSAQDRIRAGEISNGLPENPTEAQISTWREANGVPAEAAGYELALEEGLVMGEDDSRIMAGVYEVSHAENVSTKAVSGLVNQMLKGRELEINAVVARDGMHTQETNRLLREEWQGDFDINKNIVGNFLQGIPEAVRENFESARMADGTMLFNSPEMLVFFANVARQINPSQTVVPNSNNPVQAITDEIKALEARMGDDDWHKDTAANARVEELYRAREAMKR